MQIIRNKENEKSIKWKISSNEKKERNSNGKRIYFTKPYHRNTFRFKKWLIRDTLARKERSIGERTEEVFST